MKRSVWVAVIVTVGLLAVASLVGNPAGWSVPRLSWAEFARAGAWVRLWLAEHSWQMPELPLAAIAWASLLCGAAAFGIALSLLAPRRARRPRVLRLARDGWSSERIARQTRLPQDAVRSLLQPGVARATQRKEARQQLPFGRTVRPLTLPTRVGLDGGNVLR